MKDFKEPNRPRGPISRVMDNDWHETLLPCGMFQTDGVGDGRFCICGWSKPRHKQALLRALN